MTKGRAEKVTTGIEGLDYILRGGLPPRRLYLVHGEPGVGKTTLALQYLLEGVKQGQKGLYITLSETREELLEIADSHGWSLDDLDIFELTALQQSQGAEPQSILNPAEVELAETMAPLLAEVERLKPIRVVFDSLSELRLLAQSPLRYRREILGLKQFFAGRNCTVLLLDDLTSSDNDLQLQSLAHGVLVLRLSSPEYGTARRRIHVQKLRGVSFRSGFHDYEITKGGIQLYPRLVAVDHAKAFGKEVVRSGLETLDTLLGGGVSRGRSLLLIGPAGAGKSVMATQFVMEAARRGESSAIFTFDELADTFLERSEGLGMDLAPLIKKGTVTLQQVDPAELSPGEFAFRVRSQVERGGARMIVIDSLSGYLQAMPDQRHLILHLHELLSYLGQRGVTTLLTLAQGGMMGAAMTSPAEVSYLADAVVSLRYFECFGEVRQAISVIKKRTGRHERSIREMRFGPKGIELGPPLKEFQGVLTGVPEFVGKKSALLGKRRK